MTNNFDLYKAFISEKFANTTLPEDDSYFVIELMRRGKDNPDMPAANYHFKNYYIRKPEDLNKYKQEIIDLCSIFRMRAYASVNYKSFKQVTLNTLVELSIPATETTVICKNTFIKVGNRWLTDTDRKTNDFTFRT